MTHSFSNYYYKIFSCFESKNITTFQVASVWKFEIEMSLENNINFAILNFSVLRRRVTFLPISPLSLYLSISFFLLFFLSFFLFLSLSLFQSFTLPLTLSLSLSVFHYSSLFLSLSLSPSPFLPLSPSLSLSAPFSLFLSLS